MFVWLNRSAVSRHSALDAESYSSWQEIADHTSTSSVTNRNDTRNAPRHCEPRSGAAIQYPLIIDNQPPNLEEVA